MCYSLNSFNSLKRNNSKFDVKAQKCEKMNAFYLPFFHMIFIAEGLNEKEFAKTFNLPIQCILN